VKFPGIQSGAPIFLDMTTLVEEYLQKQDIGHLGEYLRSIDHMGVSGRIQFTSEGSVDRQHVLYRVRAAALELMSGFARPLGSSRSKISE
jgi:hypothetical protein